jgi:membrane-associated phospholipid phosphatase
MRFRSFQLALLLSSALVTTPFCARQPAAPTGATRDWTAFIGPWPRQDTPEGRDDAAILLWLQRHRTTAEVDRARTEVDLTYEAFSGVLGRELTPTAMPLTWKLLDTAAPFLRKTVFELKLHYGRPRPYDADPRIQPAVKKEHSLSYPSGHASAGAFWAAILAAANPSRAQAILERGCQIGTDRNVVGIHWPTDVEAGQKLGKAMAEVWLADPAHRALVDKARVECEPMAAPPRTSPAGTP